MQLSPRASQFPNSPFACGCVWLLLLWAGALPAAEVVQNISGSNILTVVELQNAVAESGRAIVSFRVEGVVCAVARERKTIVLQDDSASALLELPIIDDSVRVGERLVVQGEQCALTRSRFGIQVGTAPIIDNDGDHLPLFKSGSVFLRSGRAPLRLEWYNGWGDRGLRLEYEGPGVPRQKVPDAVLWRKPGGATNAADFQRGLDVAAYAGKGWLYLPDFERLQPVAKGVATNFDLTHRKGEDSTALVFTGYLQIGEPGVYTFHLESDDGGRLNIGDPSSYCQVTTSGRKSTPSVSSFESVLAGARVNQWVEVEGQVVSLGQNDSGLEVKVAHGGERVRATVLGGTLPALANLLQQQVRVTGICETSYDAERRSSFHIVAPSADQIVVGESSAAGGLRDSSKETILTAARQILRLAPAQARQKIPARIRGVVTEASSTALVLQDSTGGVFIRYASGDWADQPRLGELWEVEGVTDPGDFSPVILATKAKFFGNGVLPEPLRPSWDQLMNGSLDAQFIEIHGLVTAVLNSVMTVLTPEGKIKITVDEARHYYAGGRELFSVRNGNVSEEMRRDYLDSVVRIRGCMVPVWNPETRQVKAGEIRLIAATVNVEETPPQDPFSIGTRQMDDLLLFDPRANALQRTKLAGQIIHARSREYYLLDGTIGLRCVTRESLALQPGDLVEAVGFPQLGNAAPVLLEAQIRKTGHAPLPLPTRVASHELLDHKHDATLVEVEALLVNDSIQQDERVLELQAGLCNFVARLKNDRRGEKSILPGSRMRLTGVYASAREDRVAGNLDPFELLLNSPGNVVILQQGPWWTVRHTIAVIAILTGGLCLALVWVTLLRRKVEERTAQLKQEIEERQLVEQRRVMEQERTRVAQDLHDELGAGLTEVGILGSLAKNPAIPQAKKNGYLDQLTEASRSLVTGLDEIVWAVNPRYDSLADLASYYSLFAQRFLNLAGIACRLDIAAALPEHPLDSRMRHGIFLAFKEALNNVVRHSGATEVKLRIEVADEQLMISIADNGRGFKPAEAAPGQDGLVGMKQRMKKLGGQCQIHHEPSPGTTVEFRLPIGKHAS